MISLFAGINDIATASNLQGTLTPVEGFALSSSLKSTEPFELSQDGTFNYGAHQYYLRVPNSLFKIG